MDEVPNTQIQVSKNNRKLLVVVYVNVGQYVLLNQGKERISCHEAQILTRNSFEAVKPSQTPAMSC